MTSLEKKIGVERVIKHMCSYGECEECEFFNPKDETDGTYWCGIRDEDGNIPHTTEWDMDSAMLGKE